jgi:hypothetical protein
MAKGAVIARILSEYDAKGTKQARKDLAELQTSFGEFGKKAKEAFAVATAASAAMAVGFGVSAVKAAMAEQQAMAVLNNTLHNTVGANEAVMASTEAYIKQAALRYNFTTDQVIPSLQSLVVATKDVAKAETLQHLAMDISANKGKDLNEVSLALAKAYLGNFNALKRMGVPLSENVIKTKDFSAATKELAAAFGGSAAAAADTFAGRVGRIGIAFDIVKKTIGNAIIVALQPFLDKFMGALPKIEAWLDSNSKKIAAFFVTGITYGVAFAQTLYDIFNFVARNIKVYAELGAVNVAEWAGTKVAAGVSALITGINTIIKTMKVLREASLAAGFAEAIATGGVSAAVGLAAATAAFVGINIALDKFDKNVQKNVKNMGDIKFNFKGLTTTAADYLKGLTGVNNATTSNSKLTAEQIKVLAQLKAMGVVPTSSTDPIELEAARINLIRQGQVEEANRVQAILDGIQAQLDANQALQRYNDILTVLADSHISSEEIQTLAAKWGISQNAVVAYIAQVTGAAASDPKDLSSPGAVAAQGWTNALAMLNKYYDALKNPPVITIPQLPSTSGKSGGGTSGGGSTGGTGGLGIDFMGKPITTATQAAADAAQEAADAAAAFADNFPDLVNNPLGLEPSELSALARSNAAAAAAMAPYIPEVSKGAMGMTVPGAPIVTSTADFGATIGSGVMGASGSAKGNEMGVGSVVVNVAGSVISQSDLISAVRNGILQDQLSGRPISFDKAVL